MSIPTWAGFVADFPDDQVEAGGDIEVFGGRNVALALGEIFAGLGCSRISEPWIVNDVGWEFDFHYGGRHSFLCRVQSFHPIYWLLLEGPSGRRGAAAHLEFWRKFAGALEQDPRFDQVLWRPSKEGPPDWDEFTLTDDLPKRRVLEELPSRPVKPKPVAAGGRLAPAIVGAWFALTVVAVAIIDANIHGSKTQSECSALAIAVLIVGVAIALRAVDQRRKAGPSSGKDSTA